MKKKLALILSAVMLTMTLAACGGGEDSEDDAVSAEAPTTDSTSATIEPAQPKPVKKDYTLYDATVERLDEVEYSVKYENRTLFSDYLINTKIISPNAVSYTPKYNDCIYRQSSRGLYVSGFDAQYGTKAMNDRILSIPFDYSFNSLGYDFNFRDPVLKIENFSEKNKGVVNDVLFGFDGDVKVNAFIRKTADNGYEVIVDPAYMYGIPVLHSNMSMCKYDINGTKIEADTIKCYITDVGDYYSEPYQAIGDKYVYAKIEMYIACYFSIKDGYISSLDYQAKTETKSPECIGLSLEILSEDVYNILTDAPDFSSADKNKEMMDTYNSIINNLSSINDDKTLGITLLDLDFDGTPELLVTRAADSTSQEYEYGVNVDIYRISAGKLAYIDTLYNPYVVGDGDNANVLGLKKRENGTRAWFSMSYKNRKTNDFQRVDYLFTLENNKLNFTEVFRRESISDTQTDYYFFGEKLVFGSYISEVGPYEVGDWEVVTWNGLEAWFGDWEMFGFIRADYCKDMKDSTYNLYSDWLIDKQQNEVKKVPLTNRELCFNIAYLVDAVYLGGYNPSQQAYTYHFLGAYAKPVIYLYPEEQTDVSVTIDIDGELTCTYPYYNDGWNVTAYPDGTLINKADGREYSYLYWEGVGASNWDFSQGFVVRGEDTVEFLQQKLEYLGLTPKEYNEFIVYWLPLMQENEYNLITFQTDEYESAVTLNVSPTPDSMLRIFMVYKPLNEYVSIPEQKLESFERKGFSVIEWGGCCFE